MFNLNKNIYSILLEMVMIVPHLTIYKMIAIPLKSRKLSRENDGQNEKVEKRDLRLSTWKDCVHISPRDEAPNLFFISSNFICSF